MKVKKVSISHPDYPTRLRTIPSPPKQLFVLGDLQKLSSTTTVSTVGSRAVTPYGRQVTTQLVGDIAGRGVSIISGLALGVDAIAHTACLQAGGYTIAVLPCGLDTIHPASNRQLAIKILEQGGALVSEYPPGTAAFKQHFVARNRIVSGLGDALLITEASERSGSLHTANFALEQGKPVLAVPGNITSNTSTGCNQLIRTGAAPILSAADILNELGFDAETKALDVTGANEQESVVLDLMRAGHTDINHLQRASQLAPQMFNQTMTMLEITGKIKPLGSGHWAIA
jgi:DNA processing protein